MGISSWNRTGIITTFRMESWRELEMELEELGMQ